MPAPALALPAPWVRPLIGLGLLAAAILVIFRADLAEMATIWWTRSTFGHCLLVLPIIGWLVWQRREKLAELVPVPSFWGLGIVAIGAIGWLLGEAAGVSAARHLGLIVMLQGSVVAMLGLAVARGLLFPLGYALFLVPFGEVFVPTLQTWTAEISMVLLGFVGLPAHIEGVFITTPSGYFEVAEACSGIKFLIAMVALGVLGAHLCFESWKRRAAFLALCVIVPILANAVRAFGTIWIADRTGIGFAASFDHVFYGWFFFGAVIALVLAIGWRFFDRPADAPAFDPVKLQPAKPEQAAPRAVATVALIGFAIALTPPLWSSALAAQNRHAAPMLTAPAIDGWRQVSAPMAYPWRARFDGADRIVAARYRDGEDRIVDLAIGYYAWQEETREIAAFGQGGLDPDSDWAWSRASSQRGDVRAYRLTAPGPVPREVAEA
ncbi:MAG: exosortase A, partial [Sphingomonadales bacterium]|nr:exosortase A [Sphingomonadales bacterium]